MSTLVKKILAPSELFTTFDASAEDTVFEFVLPRSDTFGKYYEHRLLPSIAIQTEGEVGAGSSIKISRAEDTDDLINGEVDLGVTGFDYLTLVFYTNKDDDAPLWAGGIFAGKPQD